MGVEGPIIVAGEGVGHMEGVLQLWGASTLSGMSANEGMRCAWLVVVASTCTAASISMSIGLPIVLVVVEVGRGCSHTNEGRSVQQRRRWVLLRGRRDAMGSMGKAATACGGVGMCVLCGGSWICIHPQHTTYHCFVNVSGQAASMPCEKQHLHVVHVKKHHMRVVLLPPPYLAVEQIGEGCVPHGLPGVDCCGWHH